MKGWIGVDFDGTLAQYDGWKGELHFGDPVPAMVERVKAWLKSGATVKIFTARVFDDEGKRDVSLVHLGLREWSRAHIGVALEATNVKDFGMIELWDDRAVRVEINTGKRVL